MPNPLKWMIELVDRLSAPAGNAGKAARRLGEDLEATGRSAKKMGSDMDNTGANLGGWVLSLDRAWAALRGLGSMAYDAASGILGLGYSFGKSALQNLAFRESTLSTFELITGSAKEAQSIWDDVTNLAAKTPFGAKTMATGMAGLMSAGFNREDAKAALFGLGDISALAGFDEGVFGAITLQLGQAKAKGKLQMDDLKRILEQAGKGGVGLEAMQGKLAKSMGITTEAAKHLIAEGLVPYDHGAKALFDTIADIGEKGVLGDVMMKQAGTLTGLFSQLEDKWESFWLTLKTGDVAGSEGLKSFRGGLQGLVNALDTSTESGRRLQLRLLGFLDSGLTRIFGDLGDDTEGKLNTALDRAEQLATRLHTAFLGLVEAGKGFFAGLGPHLDKLGTLDIDKPEAFGLAMKVMGEHVGNAAGTLIRFIDKLGELVGWLDKLEAKWNLISRVVPAGVLGALPGVGPFAGALLTASNATGAPTPAGAAAGQAVVNSGAAGVLKASASFTPRQPRIVSIVIPIDNRGNGSDPEAIKRSLETALPSIIGSAFEGIAQEGGGG